MPFSISAKMLQLDELTVVKPAIFVDVQTFLPGLALATSESGYFSSNAENGVGMRWA